MADMQMATQKYGCLHLASTSDFLSGLDFLQTDRSNVGPSTVKIASIVIFQSSVRQFLLPCLPIALPEV